MNMGMYPFNEKYTTNPELEFLKHDFTGSRLFELEKDIKTNGCKEPVVIVDNTILDGSKRLQICWKHGIHYDIQNLRGMPFADCIAYICLMQLKRSDLPVEMSRYLVGRYFQAKVSPLRAPESAQSSSLIPRYTHNFSKMRIAKELAPEVNLAAVTILKYDFLAQNVDAIRTRCPELAMKILSDSLFISHENVRELSRLPKEDLTFLNRIIDQDGLTRLVYSDIVHELRWRTTRRSGGPGRKAKNEPLPAIRDMPKYDPDSEISSLALTIPSWVSSISRTDEKTDFESTTFRARQLLLDQLNLLDKSICKIKNSLKEAMESEQ